MRACARCRDDDGLAGVEEAGVGNAVGLANGSNSGAVLGGNAQHGIAALDSVRHRCMR